MNRNEVANLKAPPNNSKDQLINAGIMAGVNLFTTLGSLGAVGLLGDIATGLVAGAIAAGSSFFVSLAIQRGLMKEPD